MPLPLMLPDDCAHSHYCEDCDTEYLCEAVLYARVNNDAACRERHHACPACVQAQAREYDALTSPDGVR
jgi:hypothetical protein